MCLLRAFIYNCLSTVYTCVEKVSRRALRGRASLVTSHVRAARALVLLTLQLTFVDLLAKVMKSPKLRDKSPPPSLPLYLSLKGQSFSVSIHFLLLHAAAKRVGYFQAGLRHVVMWLEWQKVGAHVTLEEKRDTHIQIYPDFGACG